MGINPDTCHFQTFVFKDTLPDFSSGNISLTNMFEKEGDLMIDNSLSFKSHSKNIYYEVNQKIYTNKLILFDQGSTYVETR